MILSFNFALYPRDELRRLHTHLVPIMDGLAEAGHRVERFAVGLKPRPAINVLPYHRAEVTAVNDLADLLAKSAEAVCVGILCLDPVIDQVADDTAEDPALARLIEVADFAWTVRPPEGIPALSQAQAKTARILYGYSAGSQGPNLGLEDKLPRDIDVTLRGAVTPRRQRVFDALVQAQYHCFWIDVLHLPHYITSDILARSKVVVDFRPDEGWRGGSPALTSQALHNAAAIVSEMGPAGWQDDFTPYVIATPSEQIVARCEQILKSGLHAGLGQAALQKFRSETSMRDIMVAALRLPAIERLTQAGRAV
jgi:hypothetical protein